MNGASRCEGRGDVLTSFQDVFGENLVDGGEEGLMAGNDHVDMRSRGCNRLADGRDDGGENGSEAGEGVCVVNMGERGFGGMGRKWSWDNWGDDMMWSWLW